MAVILKTLTIQQVVLPLRCIVFSCLIFISINWANADTPPSNMRLNPTEYLSIADFPSPYDNEPDIPAQHQLEALVWKPAGDGPFPVVIMMHGVGGLYYKTNPDCVDNDRQCWGIAEKFKYWGKLLSNDNPYGIRDKFLVIAVDSYTTRGYDHFGVVNIPAAQRDLNVTSYLGRPWDLYAAINYLKTREDVNPQQIFTLGFSDGGGTVLSSIASSDNAVMVNESNYFQGIDNNSTIGRSMMQNIGIKAAATLYPSCGFFGYFNGVYATYAPLLVQIGADDMTTLASLCENRQSDAYTNGIEPQNFVLDIYQGMTHGFDYLQYETAQACLATEKILKFFSTQLGDAIFKNSFDGKCM